MDEVKYEFYFNQKLTKEEPVKTVVAGFWLIKGGKKYKIKNGYLDWDEYKKIRR